MTRRDKILDKMRTNPSGWRIEDLESLAEHFDIAVRKSGGSHVVFHHAQSPIAVTVPARRPIKPPYVRKFLELIDDIAEK